MSAVLKAAKISRVSRAHPGVFARYHRGDPGFLDGLWNGIKGAVGGLITGGPLGGIAGGIGGLAGGTKGASKGMSLVGRLMPQVNVATAGAAGVLAGSALPGAGIMPRWPQLPGRTTPSDGGIPGPVEWMKNQGVRFPDQAGGGCPTGYHSNKSGYYTKGGYVAPGTACVKNRKRNPLNPRAASRAMARLTSAKKATRAIAKFFGEGRKKQLALPSGKGGCGCRKR